MRKFYIILIALLMLSGLKGQSCLPEGIIFTTQAEIDSFQFNYPNCTEIEGSITINGEDIINLIGLSLVTSIGDSLKIYYTSLENLNGLNALNYVGGEIYLESNPNLLNLTGLESLTSIEGSLEVWFNDMLNNLEGLDGLASIGGDMFFANNNAVSDLSGLDNLTSIGGLLYISRNDGMNNLIGLESLNNIGDGLTVRYMSNMANFLGLANLVSVGGALQISDNEQLTSFIGLEALTSLGGDLYIRGNNALTSLNGLEGLTSISGDILITSNNALNSIAALGNINPSSIINLYIWLNGSLSDCETQNICSYLANPNGSINIYLNAVGCNNPTEVASGCGITLPCLPYGNYYFYEQSDIDNFQSNFPGCTELSGDIFISMVNNLNGLNMISSITGSLDIYSYIAYSLSGLDALTNIGGSLYLWGNNLTSLTGLENLAYIGGSLMLGDKYLGGNQYLTNLEALDGLNFIGAELFVYDNASLASLVGLENIAEGSVTDLSVYNNFTLSECDIVSICNYLANPNGTVDIHDNAPGCYNQQEVESACEVGLLENYFLEHFSVSPNPFSDKTTINFLLPETSRVKIVIDNILGQIQQVLWDADMERGRHQFILEGKDLSPGVYICCLTAGKQNFCTKLVKMK